MQPQKTAIICQLSTSRKSKTMNVSGNVSKDCYWAKLTFMLQGGWNRNDSYLLRNDTKVGSCQDMFYIEPEVDMNKVSLVVVLIFVLILLAMTVGITLSYI